MKIIHGNWTSNAELVLWGEDQQRAKEAKAGRQHPFALRHGDLSRLLEQVDIEDYRSGSIDLWLPLQNDAGSTVPAPSWIAPENDEAVSFGRFSAPAARLDALQALFFLTELPVQTGFKIGDSLRFWTEATKLALELLARGSILPVMSRERGENRARWQPLLSHREDRERFKTLCESMPAVCRAVQDHGKNRTEAETLFDSFLSTATDSLVRYFLRRKKLAPEINELHATNKTRASLAWLNALVSADGRLPLHPELNELDQRLRIWRSAYAPHHELERLTLGLTVAAPGSDPGDGSDALWPVRFFVSPAGQSGLQLKMSDFWREKLNFLGSSSSSFSEFEELILRELARMAEVFPPLRRALTGAFPEEALLNTNEAYDLLTEGGQLLENSGFTVVYPDWWAKQRKKLGLRLNVSGGSDAPSGPSVLGLNSLLNFSWQVALGEEALSADEFREIVSRQTPLVKVRGEWIELRPKKAALALEFLESQQKKKQLKLIDALRLGLGLEDEELALPVVGMTTSGWVKQLLDTEARAYPRLEQPAEFQGALRPYQLDGLSWLNLLDNLGIGCCLADDMGLGKTIQFLSLLLAERERQHSDAEPIPPTLLVVPMSILDNWQREAKKFAPNLRVIMHHGANREATWEFLKLSGKVDLVITTYNLIYRDEPLFLEAPWSRIALDEAQNIKNVKTKQTSAIRRLVRRQIENRGLSGISRVALTGTPVENRLSELWSIFDFLNPGYLSSLRDFRSRFATPIERFRDREATARLHRYIKPFILRRLKTDQSVISDLPEKIEMEIFTSLTKEQAALYQSVVEEMLPQMEASTGIRRKGIVLSTITRLKQICDHPQLYLNHGTPEGSRSGELEALDDMLDIILSEGDRVLVFTQYAQMGHLLKAHLEERFSQEVLFLHGAQPKSVRTKQVERFESSDGPQIFLLSLKAGGFGLNLTRANQVIHYDLWWNPAVQDQATDRAYRIGQRQNVQVRKLIAKGTLEERISEMLREKRSLADSIVSESKNMVTELSTEELKKLLTLTEAYSDA